MKTLPLQNLATNTEKKTIIAYGENFVEVEKATLERLKADLKLQPTEFEKWLSDDRNIDTLVFTGWTTTNLVAGFVYYGNLTLPTPVTTEWVEQIATNSFIFVGVTCLLMHISKYFLTKKYCEKTQTPLLYTKKDHLYMRETAYNELIKKLQK